MSILNWKLELQSEEAMRLPKLQRPVPFEQIAKDIAAGMIVLCCHRGSMNATGSFSRVIHCVQLDKDLFDLFFNSASGYRAAYFRFPWEGMGANAAFLKAVTASFLAADYPAVVV